MNMLKQIYYCYVVFVVLVIIGVVLLAPQRASVLKGSISVDVSVLEKSTADPSPSRTPPTTLSQLAAPTTSQPTSNESSWPTKPLHLFGEKVVSNAEEILHSAWVAKLKKMLDGSGNQVSVIFANYGYLESALNWLIAAQVRLQPPLTDVIVICLDTKISRVLDERKIPSIFVDPNSIIKSSQGGNLGKIWMTRMVVYRLVNYFGHDLMAYDSDAIVLRNPQEILKQHQYSDIISSAGKFPFALSRKWGFTACMGVILFRSSSKTELLWESMRNTHIYDDQNLLNTAFNNCHIQWQSEGKNINRQSIDGQCASGLRVTVLPHSNICRYSCKKSDSPYIWHKLSSKVGTKKIAAARRGGVWFLRSSWKDSNLAEGNLTGTQWLSALSVS